MCSLTLRTIVSKTQLVRPMPKLKEQNMQDSIMGNASASLGVCGVGVREGILESVASKVRPEGYTVIGQVRKRGKARFSSGKNKC